MRFDVLASDFDPIAFSDETCQIETVFLWEKIRFIVRAEIRANAKTNYCCGLAPRRDALKRCTAQMIQASEPTLVASGLAAKRRAECARVNLSWHLAL